MTIKTKKIGKNIYTIDSFSYNIERTGYAESIGMNTSKDLCDIENITYDDMICYRCISDKESIVPAVVPNGAFVCPK